MIPAVHIFCLIKKFQDFSLETFLFANYIRFQNTVEFCIATDMNDNIEQLCPVTSKWRKDVNIIIQIPERYQIFFLRIFFSNLDIILCEWNNLGQFLFWKSWLHFYSMYTNEGCPRVRGQSCILSFLKWVYIFILYIEMSVIKSQIKLKKFWVFSITS